jgi:hypothetical protein
MQFYFSQFLLSDYKFYTEISNLKKNNFSSNFIIELQCSIIGRIIFSPVVYLQLQKNLSNDSRAKIIVEKFLMQVTTKLIYKKNCYLQSKFKKKHIITLKCGFICTRYHFNKHMARYWQENAANARICQKAILF